MNLERRLPHDIEKRIQLPFPEGGYWRDWIDAIAEVGEWDEQIENLRNAGHLGQTTIYENKG